MKNKSLLYLMAAMIYVTPAFGAVVSTTGTIVIEPSPYPAPSDTNIFVFNEQQGIAFVSSQLLDYGTISEGALVNSHYIQFDPVTPSRLISGGSITFDSVILGVVTLTDRLNQDLGSAGTSDSYFGLFDSLGAYPTGDDPAARGLGSPEDDLTINLGTTTLVVDSLEIPGGTSAGNLDGFRVFTAVVPVPATVWLFGTGLIVLIGIARRKKS